MSSKFEHDLDWTDEILENFIKLGRLNQNEANYMRHRVANETEEQTSKDVGLAKATYYRWLKRFRRIYDNLADKYPDKFPLRGSNCLYDIKFENIKGITTIGGNEINFEGQSFDHILKARKFVVENAEEIFQDSFSNLGKQKLVIAVICDVDIKPKK